MQTATLLLVSNLLENGGVSGADLVSWIGASTAFLQALSLINLGEIARKEKESN
jgi:hypothetical protein